LALNVLEEAVAVAFAGKSRDGFAHEAWKRAGLGESGWCQLVWEDVWKRFEQNVQWFM